MEMIRHEAEGEELDWMSGLRCREEVHEGPIIPVRMEHRGAAIAAIEDVEGVTGEVTSWDAGHGERVRENGASGKRKVACPLYQYFLSFSPLYHSRGRGSRPHGLPPDHGTADTTAASAACRPVLHPRPCSHLRCLTYCRRSRARVRLPAVARHVPSTSERGMYASRRAACTALEQGWVCFGGLCLS